MEQKSVDLVKRININYNRRRMFIKGIEILLLISILSLIMLAKSLIGSAKIQSGIAEEIIRFHVLANSDTKEDQALKIKVKNDIVTYLQEKLAGASTKAEAKQIINENMGTILAIGQKRIEQEGYSYVIKGSITRCYFPTKIYGDLVFPPGNYEALRIIIGKAEGKNWWCVMFPSLCMVNESYTVVPDESKEKLQNVLDEDEYEEISEETPEVEIQSGLWNFICDIF